MNFDPRIHHRHSIRLKGYDYSRAGLFFITIDVQNKLCLFGKVVNCKKVLNEPGKMVERWYYEMENKFPDKRCHEMIVMPNHFHCILENVETYYIHLPSAHATGTDAHVGASLRGRPDPQTENTFGIHNKKYGATIGESMDWFKTMTTNEYIHGVKQHGWPRFNGKLWQRGYYERIIRNEKAYQTISSYILDNPAKWEKDKLCFL